MSKRKIVLLGATGSIGDSTLEVIRGNPDKLELVGIAGNKNWKKLSKIAKEFNVKYVSLSDEKAYLESKNEFADAKLFCGKEGLTEIACLNEANTVVAAVVGTEALVPTLNAIEKGKDIALANKELLVMAGKFVMEAAKRKNVAMLPLDSEHNAIFQCLSGERREDLDKLIITASGGMFRDFTNEQMLHIKPEDALKHPNWNMGPKVTIDSSTLANKGLEVIEAKWLFGVSADDIEVVVHRQSIVHSMVRFKDGSIVAHLSPPSMTFAISHSLMYPTRGNPVHKSLDFSKMMSLDFCPPDTKRFPCLAHAFNALRVGGTATTAFNASNEIAVESFLKGEIKWIDIPKIVELALEKCNHLEPKSLNDVLSADAEVRLKSKEFIKFLK